MNRKLFSTSTVQDENRIWTSWLMPWSLASCRKLSRNNNLWCAWKDLKVRQFLCCLFLLAFCSNSKNCNLHFANHHNVAQELPIFFCSPEEMAVFKKDTELVPGSMNGTGIELFFSCVLEETDQSQVQHTNWSCLPSVNFHSCICALDILINNHSNKTSVLRAAICHIL